MAEEQEEKKSAGSVRVLKDFFGYRPNTGLKEFGEELKALSDEEKIALTEGIQNGSLTY